MAHDTTYDGSPIAKEPPFGATIIVYRKVDTKLQFLLLHRAHSGPDYEGDWAWTPPAGARQPGEDIIECAERELLEEVGLRLALQPTEFGTTEWRVYAAMANDGHNVVLDEEHDRYEWTSLEHVSRCKPDFVASHIVQVSEMLGAWHIVEADLAT